MGMPDQNNPGSIQATLIPFDSICLIYLIFIHHMLKYLHPYWLRRIRSLFLLIALLLFAGSIVVQAQLCYSGRPIFAGQTTEHNVPVITLPSFDETAFRCEIEKGNHWFKTLLFARDFKVSYQTGNSGLWTTTDDGNSIWRLGFYSPGARSMAVSFSTFDIPSEGKVFVHSRDGTEWLGAFTRRSSGRNNDLSVAPVTGDMLFIEFQVPTSMVQQCRLTVGMVSHGFDYPAGEKIKADSLAQSSGFCQVDINCPEGYDWQVEKRAVCRILLHKFFVLHPGDTVRWMEICSGVLVNNTRNDNRPLLLTANHCIRNGYEAGNAVFFFGYESPSCDGPDGFNKNSLFGSTLLATSDKIDFALVELDQDPPLSYEPYFAGWNRSPTAPQRTVCIHHPQGDVKKIALDNDPPFISTYSGFDNESCWLIDHWETGTTESGSSGSPLFGTDHYVIGVLSGGLATCVNPVTDYFCRFSVAWDSYPDSLSQLKYWLDPIGNGRVAMPGQDPTRTPDATLTIFPNPTKRDVTIEFRDSRKEVEVRIYDLSGQLLFVSTKFSCEPEAWLNISWLPAGIYIIRITDGSSVFTRKIVKINE